MKQILNAVCSCSVAEYNYSGKSGPNFMALLTVSTESPITKGGNSVLMASVSHELAANVCFWACVPHVTKHSRSQG